MDIISNVGIYAAIAEEAFARMQEATATNRRPKPDGSPGFVITFDPCSPSFKDAMVATVFAYMFLEGACWIANLRREGAAKAKREDSKSDLEIRLRNLGADDALVGRAKKLREDRRQLVHEKAIELSAIGSGPWIKAQDLATEAIGVMRDVIALLGSDLSPARPESTPAQ